MRSTSSCRPCQASVSRPAHRLSRRQLLEGRRPLAHPDDRDPGTRSTRPGGCDIGGIVSSQLGHKYADELYGIHIGLWLPLEFFTRPRAWDFARNRPLTDDQPAEVRARIIERDHRSASHLALRMRDGATLAHGLSDSPAGLLACCWSAGTPGATPAATSSRSSLRTTYSFTARSTG
jgi:hypothetical protein